MAAQLCGSGVPLQEGVDKHTGDIISCSKWALVGADDVTKAELRRPDLPEGFAVPEGLDDEFTEDFTGRVLAVKAQELGGGPHLRESVPSGWLNRI